MDYNKDAIRRCGDLAQRYGVNVDCINKDLEKTPQPLEEYAAFDVILVSRYLHRPLFPAIKTALKPGGFLLYHTFMRGAEKISQPKNPNYLLESAELAEYFADFSILADSVEKLSDGRPLSYFIAQKL
jgi:SAM-dependent methyltransferase